MAQITSLRPFLSLGEFKARVQGTLSQCLEHSPMRQKVAPLLLNPQAKLLRPELVWSFGRLSGAPPQALIEIAASAELLHAASLVHDDVIDESSERRGSPTLHITHGVRVAILAGDHLLAKALELTSFHGPRIVRAAARAMAQMSGAASQELEARAQCRGPILFLPNAELRPLASGKTGALFGYCLEAVACLEPESSPAALDARCLALRQAGERLGVAFQYLDDLQDLRGGAGKPRGADLREKNPNAVVTAAGELGHYPQHLGELITHGHVVEACELLLSPPAPLEVESWISRELDEAELLLEQYASHFAQDPQIQALIGKLRSSQIFTQKQEKSRHAGKQKHHHV